MYLTLIRPYTRMIRIASEARKGIKIKIAKLIPLRELSGNLITFRRGKANFLEQCLKIRTSKATIWEYECTRRSADGALDQLHADIVMPDGTTEADFLLAGNLSGSLYLYEIGEVRHFNYAVKYIPDLVWPPDKEIRASPELLWSCPNSFVDMRSSISSIRTLRQDVLVASDASTIRHALVTTLGSETSGGSVFLLNLNEPLECNSNDPLGGRINEVTSFNSTIWTADWNFDGKQAVIGTNRGAALINMESGMTSWICRCKSDVLSVQLDYSGNIALCGLRNGAIVMIDARQKPQTFSGRLTRHRVPYRSYETAVPSSGNGNQATKKWLEVKGNVHHSHTISMPSSVTCLASLRLHDQYFLASSMDGSIMLHDHRLFQRGPVQLYKGNVNSHSRIQLGIDPSERFVTSGGEDYYLRLWSIKSGEMLFEEKFRNCVPSVVCWPGGYNDSMERHGGYGYKLSSGAWFGSWNGIFYVQYV